MNTFVENASKFIDLIAPFTFKPLERVGDYIVDRVNPAYRVNQVMPVVEPKAKKQAKRLVASPECDVEEDVTGLISDYKPLSNNTMGNQRDMLKELEGVNAYLEKKFATYGMTLGDVVHYENNPRRIIAQIEQHFKAMEKYTAQEQAQRAVIDDCENCGMEYSEESAKLNEINANRTALYKKREELSAKLDECITLSLTKHYGEEFARKIINAEKYYDSGYHNQNAPERLLANKLLIEIVAKAQDARKFGFSNEAEQEEAEAERRNNLQQAKNNVKEKLERSLKRYGMPDNAAQHYETINSKALQELVAITLALIEFPNKHKDAIYSGDDKLIKKYDVENAKNLQRNMDATTVLDDKVRAAVKEHYGVDEANKIFNVLKNGTQEQAEHVIKQVQSNKKDREGQAKCDLAELQFNPKSQSASVQFLGTAMQDNFNEKTESNLPCMNYNGKRSASASAGNRGVVRQCAIRN